MTKQHTKHTFESYRQYLEEKLIIVGKGQKYEQVIILAGGAGSGKGYATTHFIDSGSYKQINTDTVKELLIKIAKNAANIKGMSTKISDIIPQINKLDLHNPVHTDQMHVIVKNLGVDEKQLFYMLAHGAGGTRSYLPNLLFDRTLKNEKAVREVTELVRNAGYKPENIHIIWVLTDYQVSLKQNYHRDRRVFNDLLISTHQGSKTTMLDVVFKDYAKYSINGDIIVIIGGPKQHYNILGGITVGTEMVPSGNQAPLTGVQNPYKPKEMIKPHFMGTAGIKEWARDFTYFRIKRAGSAGVDQAAIDKVVAFAGILAPPQQPFDSNVNKMFPQTAQQ